MAVSLREHQIEVSGADGSNSMVLGTEDTGFLTTTRPEHVGGDVRTGDRDNPGEDGRGMGQDFISGKSVNLEMAVMAERNAGSLYYRVLDKLDRLEGFWTHRRWRADPKARAMIRMAEGGATWRALGRPRLYAETVGASVRGGLATVSCSFDLDGIAWYTDVEYQADARIPPAPGTGFTSTALSAPFSTTLATQGTADVKIQGTKETWPVYQFNGPITNPILAVGDRVIGIKGSIAAGEAIEVDPRPWVRRVYRVNDGASLAGRIMGVTTPMPRLYLEPGSYVLRYSGTDTTGASFGRIRWRDARSRPAPAEYFT